MKHKLIYLDNNATTSILPEVFNEMVPYLTDFYGNPSAIYPFGVNIKRKVEQARHNVATLIGAKDDEIIFTSGGTESNCSAIMSVVNKGNKRHIISSVVEHYSILSTLNKLNQQGYEIDLIPVDSTGRINYQEIAQVIRDDTGLITIMLANNEIGNIYEIEKVVEIGKKNNIPVHTDAIQAVGKIPVNVKNLGVSMLSLSGHKFHSPKGVGALFVDEDFEYTPLIWGHQESNLRGGTENVASIIGMGKAAEVIKNKIINNCDYTSEIKSSFEKFLSDEFHDSYIYGDPIFRLPNTTNFAFDCINGEEVVLYLASKNIIVSTGSACNSRNIKPSHVLTAMGIPENRIRSIRVSFNENITQEDLTYVMDQIKNVYQKFHKKGR